MLINPPELAEYQIASDILTFFLHVLCMMHVYWIILITNMYIQGVMKGDTDDKQRAAPTPKSVNDEPT